LKKKPSSPENKNISKNAVLIFQTNLTCLVGVQSWPNLRSTSHTKLPLNRGLHIFIIYIPRVRLLQNYPRRGEKIIKAFEITID